MALNRNATRADLVYLSRRRKGPAQVSPAASSPVAQSPAVQSPAAGSPVAQSPAAGSPAPSGLTLGARTGTGPAVPPAPSSPSVQSPAPSGLTLGASPGAGRAAGAPTDATSTARMSVPRAATVAERLFPAPAFGSLRQLSATAPVVRLNARQSAIGSMLVAGARSVAWEDNDRTTGAHHADGHHAGAAVTTPGNRPLAGIQDLSGVVPLRHVRLLRRALFIAGEAPLTIGVFDGAAAAVPARDEDGRRSVLYVSRIGPILELRAEFVPAEATDAAIWEIFGFTMTIPLDRNVLPR